MKGTSGVAKVLTPDLLRIYHLTEVMTRGRLPPQMIHRTGWPLGAARNGGSGKTRNLITSAHAVDGPRFSNYLKRDVSFIWIFLSRENPHLVRGPGCLGSNEGIVTTKSTEAITVALRPPEASAEKTRAGADWINRQSQRPFRLKGGIQEEFLAVVATFGHIR